MDFVCITIRRYPHTGNGGAGENEFVFLHDIVLTVYISFATIRFVSYFNIYHGLKKKNTWTYILYYHIFVRILKILRRTFVSP